MQIAHESDLSFMIRNLQCSISDFNWNTDQLYTGTKAHNIQEPHACIIHSRFLVHQSEWLFWVVGLMVLFVMPRTWARLPIGYDVFISRRDSCQLSVSSMWSNANLLKPSGLLNYHVHRHIHSLNGDGDKSLEAKTKSVEK